MTNYKSTITELHYLADWAKHHLDKAKIANDAAVSIEALQSKLGDAIQSSAHWQHQFTEAQAENERLKDDLDDAIRGPWAEWAEKITKSVRKRSGYDGFDDQAEGVDLPTEVEDCLCELEHLIKKIASERDALKSKLDAMGKGEPVAHCRMSPLRSDEFTRRAVVQWVKEPVEGPLYAAPKALAPLTDEQCDQVAAQTMDAVAKARDMHALDLNPNIQEHHTLRRELIRAGFAIGIGGTP